MSRWVYSDRYLALDGRQGPARRARESWSGRWRTGDSEPATSSAVSPLLDDLLTPHRLMRSCPGYRCFSPTARDASSQGLPSRDHQHVRDLLLPQLHPPSPSLPAPIFHRRSWIAKRALRYLDGPSFRSLPPHLASSSTPTRSSHPPRPYPAPLRNPTSPRPSSPSSSPWPLPPRPLTLVRSDRPRWSRH